MYKVVYNVVYKVVSILDRSSDQIQSSVQSSVEVYKVVYKVEQLHIEIQDRRSRIWDPLLVAQCPLEVQITPRVFCAHRMWAAAWTRVEA